jgi:hypothetical protein
MVGLLIAAYALYDELFAILEASGYIHYAKFPASMHGFFGFIYLLIGLVIVKMADLIEVDPDRETAGAVV